MFDHVPPPVEVRLRAVSSVRDSWHPDVGTPVLQQRLLAVDVSVMGADEALSTLVTVQAQRAALDALEARLLVRAAGATRVVRDVVIEDSDGLRRLSFTDEVLDEIAAALHRPQGLVQAQVANARLLHGPLARTLAELAAGRITDRHATQIADQAGRMLTRPLGQDTDADARFDRSCAELQDRVLAHARKETHLQCRARARRVVNTIDAAGARDRRRRARKGCDVLAWGEDDGLGVIMARLPVGDVASILGTVDLLARTDTDALAADIAARTGDIDPTLGQLRATAFTRLFRHARGADSDAVITRAVGVDIQVVIDAATLVGITRDLPAYVQVGSGEPVAMDRDDLIALLTDSHTPCTLRRLVTGPGTGALVDRGAHAYAVSPELAAWIASRDVTCRHPGCTRPALTCDVDHAIDHHKGGPTTIGNTGSCCRRHHNRKTHGNWRIEDPQPDGSCTFISPAGHRYHHGPVRLLPQPPPLTPKVNPPESEPTHEPTDDKPFPF